jgi:hypothetical protein
MSKGICWIDGRHADVKARRTIIGAKVTTCADGKGCDTRPRRRGPLTAAVLVALALLTGCAPDSGTVTDRKTTVRCVGNNAISCDPTWKLLIVDSSHRHPVYTDRPDSGWANVTEAEYGRCPVGAAWPDCKTGGR